jgi:two-component system sensor histidine kinase HydH
LGLIRGWTQRLAQADATSAQRLEHAHAVIEECDRVTARINQFLAFARPRDPQVTVVDVEMMLGELAAILQPDLESAGLSLKWDIAPVRRRVRADFEMLRQVLFNLLQNAIQFSPAGATIDVSVEAAANHRVAIRVADRGPGVPAESVESLFTPYYTTRAQGTGLGLAIVRHLAALHGWQVTYSPREGGGALFEIGGMHVPDEDHSHRR